MPVEVFKPKPSAGWVWWVALAVLIVGSIAPIPFFPQSEPVPVWVTPILWGTVGLGVFFLLIAALFPTMRYELTETELVLRYGPLLTYRIPYAALTGIERRNLEWSMWSSMRLPGLALWKVQYAKDGVVKMCSTRSARGVLVIRTTDPIPYGISPAEEDRFVHELLMRARKTGAEPTLDMSSIPPSR